MFPKNIPVNIGKRPVQWPPMNEYKWITYDLQIQLYHERMRNAELQAQLLERQGRNKELQYQLHQEKVQQLSGARRATLENEKLKAEARELQDQNDKMRRNRTVVIKTSRGTRTIQPRFKIVEGRSSDRETDIGEED